MNKRQQEQFIYFFDELCQAQQVLDNLKIQLLHKPGYNPHPLFEMLSQGNQEITISQMRNYLTERIACTHRQLYEIFQKFDSKRNGFITRQDFVREITPLKKSPPQGRQGIVNSQIETLFLQIIIEMLKRFRIIEQSRKQIVLIQPYQAFAHIDCSKTGIIGIGDLKRLYNDNDFQISEFSLVFLLHALRRRFHRNVTLQLFCESLNPLQFGQYFNFAQEIRKQNEKQFLKRSRRQQEAVRISRIDDQLNEYEIQRAQRRKRADIQRHLDLSNRIDMQLADYDRQQQDSINKALLQEQKQIRSRSQLEHDILERNYKIALEESRRSKEIALLQQQQRLINHNLSRKILQQQAALSASKQRRAIEDEIAIQQEIEREKQVKRMVAYQRQADLERNRRQLQAQRILERQSYIRQIQQQRMSRRIQSELPSSLVKSIKQSRIQQLEYELEKTRAEMRERRQRLQIEDKMRSLQTASKSRVSAFPY